MTVITEMEKLKLATMLKRLVKERGMSLRQLARETKISVSTLSGWSNGLSPRDLTEVRTCAIFFGVSLERLLFDEDSAQQSSVTVFEGHLRIKIERIAQKKIGG